MHQHIDAIIIAREVQVYLHLPLVVELADQIQSYCSLGRNGQPTSLDVVRCGEAGFLMSQTISVGVVGPSHWAYMATVMAECLEEITKTNRIPTNLVPAGVYQDALAFSQLAVQAAGASVPDNPPASFNAYVIASEVLRRSSQELPQTREDINYRLERYETFLRTLDAPRELTDAEKELVASLIRFFARLKEEGEAEAYTKAMYLESVPTGFPLR